MLAWRIRRSDPPRCGSPNPDRSAPSRLDSPAAPPADPQRDAERSTACPRGPTHRRSPRNSPRHDQMVWRRRQRVVQPGQGLVGWPGERKRRLRAAQPLDEGCGVEALPRLIGCGVDVVAIALHECVHEVAARRASAEDRCYSPTPKPSQRDQVRSTSLPAERRRMDWFSTLSRHIDSVPCFKSRRAGGRLSGHAARNAVILTRAHGEPR